MSVWDKLAVSTPQDRTAGVVISRSAGMVPAGPTVPPGLARWATPPATKRVAPGQPDLTGRRVGWLTVVGYLGKSNRKKRGRWLVRCRCGYFEARGAKAITHPGADGDACCECKHHEQLKARDRAAPARATQFAGTSRRAGR